MINIMMMYHCPADQHRTPAVEPIYKRDFLRFHWLLTISHFQRLSVVITDTCQA